MRVQRRDVVHLYRSIASLQVLLIEHHHLILRTDRSTVLSFLKSPLPAPRLLSDIVLIALGLNLLLGLSFVATFGSFTSSGTSSGSLLLGVGARPL